jgi:hypothetical protein
MGKDHIWGGDLELSILSKTLQCSFVIHANNRPDITVSFLLQKEFLKFI